MSKLRVQLIFMSDDIYTCIFCRFSRYKVAGIHTCCRGTGNLLSYKSIRNVAHTLTLTS